MTERQLGKAGLSASNLSFDESSSNLWLFLSESTSHFTQSCYFLMSMNLGKGTLLLHDMKLQLTPTPVMQLTSNSVVHLPFRTLNQTGSHPILYIPRSSCGFSGRTVSTLQFWHSIYVLCLLGPRKTKHCPWVSHVASALVPSHNAIYVPVASLHISISSRGIGTAEPQPHPNLSGSF